MATIQGVARMRQNAFIKTLSYYSLLSVRFLYCVFVFHTVFANGDINQDVVSPKDFTIPSGTDYDREALMKLTEFRQRHRKTVDGMLCAAAFVRNGNTFTDCTTTEAPDGSVGREWCYVEVQLIGVGSRDWDFCAGTVDYDVIRSKASLLSKLKSEELAHSVLQLSATEQRLENTLKHFDAVCGHGTASHENDMNTISHSLRGLERALQQVEANSQSLHMLNEEYESLSEQLEITRKSVLNDKRNCSIVQGYSVAVVGDGVRASYFDNPYLRGPPVGFFDHSSLSLTFDEILPINGVDIRSFSVRFETYLRVPVSGDYTFWLDADCNFLMFVDGELVIKHGLEGRGTFASAYNSAGVVALDGRTTTSTLVSSRKMSLVGGKRYPLVLEYSHQSSLKYRDENVVRLILSWETDTRSRTIIDPDYFFRSRDSGESLIISGLDARWFDLAMLENGAQAFINVTNLLLADVPDHLRGMRMVRTVVKPDYDTVDFYISHDAFLYVAQSEHLSYIPMAENMSTFDRSWEVISVYSIGHNCEEATSQQEFIVFYKRFKAGPVKIHILPETSFFLFMQPAAANAICPDDVQYLPFKNGDGCASSSSLSAAFDCSKAFGSGYWQPSSGRITGQWLMRTFTNPVELVHFHFSPIDGSLPMRAIISFPDGSEEDFELHSQLRYELGYHGVVDSIRIMIETMSPGDGITGSDTVDNKEIIGGTFAFYGRECGARTTVEEAVHFPIHISFCQGGHACGPDHLDLGHMKGYHGRLSYGWGSSNVVADIADLQICKPQVNHIVDVNLDSVPLIDRELTELPATTKNHSVYDLLLKQKAGLPLGQGQRWTIDVPEHGVYNVEVLLSALCTNVESASLLINNVEMLEVSAVLCLLNIYRVSCFK
uniref:PA14 domain containing protein n=1 Tax=Babesia bovis TaxID=5865 RepID=A7AWC6_BABBO|eukprot:XP_001608922.1 PA14 domain containing protein [Babesia bovis T2Bo]